MAVEAKQTKHNPAPQRTTPAEDSTLSTLDHLAALAAALGGTQHKQGAVEWWTYWLEDRSLTVRFDHAAQPKGAYTVYTRERGTFSALEERSRQHFSEATLTQLERQAIPLEEALTQLGMAVLRHKRPRLCAQIEKIVRFGEVDAFVFIRMSDLEFFVQFGAIESLEGCLYLCSIPADSPQALPSQAA
jgi:hypothetical protein